MKTLLSLFLILFLQIQNQCAKSQTDNLNLSITQIIKAFESNDSPLVNQYIHPELGLVVLFKRGVMDEFTVTKTMDFDSPIPEYMPYFPFNAEFEIKYDALPIFDCDSEDWNKTGIFCDTTRRDHLLSKIAQDLNEIREDNIPTETIQTFLDMEMISHRVVLVDGKSGEFIFSITLIDNKWYLTILDRVTSDCSA